MKNARTTILIVVGLIFWNFLAIAPTKAQRLQESNAFGRGSYEKIDTIPYRTILLSRQVIPDYKESLETDSKLQEALEALQTELSRKEAMQKQNNRVKTEYEKIIRQLKAEKKDKNQEYKNIENKLMQAEEEIRTQQEYIDALSQNIIEIEKTLYKAKLDNSTLTEQNRQLRKELTYQKWSKYFSDWRLAMQEDTSKDASLLREIDKKDKELTSKIKEINKKFDTDDKEFARLLVLETKFAILNLRDRHARELDSNLASVKLMIDSITAFQNKYKDSIPAFGTAETLKKLSTRMGMPLSSIFNNYLNIVIPKIVELNALLEQKNEELENGGDNKIKLQPEPKLISALGSGVIKPSFDFSFENTRRIKKSNFYDSKTKKRLTRQDFYALRLFASPSQGGLDSNRRKTDILFHPDLSSWGIKFDYTQSYDVVDGDENNNLNLGINFGIYYLGKQPTSDTVGQYTVGTIQFKFGVQYLILKNFISIYSNVNVIGLLHDTERFKREYSLKKDIYSYLDVGAKLYFPITSGDNKGFNLFADFGFVIRGGDVKVFAPSNRDAVIPFVQIGVTRTFSF